MTIFFVISTTLVIANLVESLAPSTTGKLHNASTILVVEAQIHLF